MQPSVQIGLTICHRNSRALTVNYTVTIDSQITNTSLIPYPETIDSQITHHSSIPEFSLLSLAISSPYALSMFASKGLTSLSCTPHVSGTLETTGCVAKLLMESAHRSHMYGGQA